MIKEVMYIMMVIGLNVLLWIVFLIVKGLVECVKVSDENVYIIVCEN